jgi:hypothetical protein
MNYLVKMEKLMSESQALHIKIQVSSWRLTGPGVHLLTWRYSKKPSLPGAFSSCLNRVPQIQPGAVIEWSHFPPVSLQPRPLLDFQKSRGASGSEEAVSMTSGTSSGRGGTEAKEG